MRDIRTLLGALGIVTRSLGLGWMHGDAVNRRGLLSLQLEVGERGSRSINCDVATGPVNLNNQVLQVQHTLVANATILGTWSKSHGDDS